MTAVGIDLGTCTSAVAVYRRGRPEVLKIDGQSVMPSCVSVDPRGGLLVGELAKRRALLDPQQTVLAIKREIGNRDYRIELGGRAYSAVEISALLLKKLVAAATEQLGEPVRDAVISVPAYFTNNQKEDTRKAGEQAGLNVLRLVPEPTAAAIAYGLNKGRDQTILVYDLGGGTFDVSILRVQGNRFDVVGIGGAHDLGGEDFDRRMIDLVLTHIRGDATLGAALQKLDAARVQQRLKESAEAAKKELSVADTAEIDLPDLIPGMPICLTVTRPQYETAIGDLVDRTISITRETLTRCRLATDDIDRLVLVGGSTRLPLVRQRVTEQLCEPYVAEHVDEVVSHGAAILAATIAGGVEEAGGASDCAPVEVSSITAHSLGIRADADKFAVLIPRGTPLPAEIHKTFTTACDNADRTDVVVFQGEEPHCSNNLQIGGFGLTGLERARAGQTKIDVRFVVDGDDILTVAAEDRSTGRTGQIRIEKFEPQPYVSDALRGPRDLSSLRIGVSKAGCDDAGQILRKLGLRFTVLNHAHFNSYKILQNYDLLFINCLADMSQIMGPGIWLNPAKNHEALQQFVSGGGILYVSDYALDNISVAFPGHIRFGGKGDGRAGKTTATVIDPTLRDLVGASYPINFNTIYAPVASVSDDCRIFLVRGKEPLLVSFAHGAGHVVYTSFHNGVQVSEHEQRLLAYIILQTISLATSTPLVELVESTALRGLDSSRKR